MINSYIFMVLSIWSPLFHAIKIEIGIIAFKYAEELEKYKTLEDLIGDMVWCNG